MSKYEVRRCKWIKIATEKDKQTPYGEYDEAEDKTLMIALACRCSNDY